MLSSASKQLRPAIEGTETRHAGGVYRQRKGQPSNYAPLLRGLKPLAAKRCKRVRILCAKQLRPAIEGTETVVAALRKCRQVSFQAITPRY